MRIPSLVAWLVIEISSFMLLSGCAVQQYAVAKERSRKATAVINTPLFKALDRWDAREILPLVAKNVEVRSSNAHGRDLMLAILEGRRAEALKLVEGGADVNAAVAQSESKLFNSYNAFMFAVWSDDKDLVKAMAAKGADVKDGLGAAVTPGMLKLLVELGAALDVSTTTGLLANALLHENAEMVRDLISRGADVETPRAAYEKSLRSLESNDAEMVAQPVMQTAIRGFQRKIQLLDRMSRPQAAPAAPQTAAAGVTKAELEQMLKAAVVAGSTPAPSAAAAATYKSDVDAPSYKVAENPDAYALVIGVEKYNTLPDARFAERDAKAMNAHLLAMGYPQRNIVLLTGSQATRTGLAKNLEAWLPNNVTERSTVMFYFSGHGAPDAKTSQAYLVPMDGDPQYLEETAYPIKRLYAKLAALKAKRVVVALDSCFSGAGGRSVLAQGTRPLVAKLELGPVQQKVVSLSASSSDEITGALEDQGHGLFTYHLLKALTETAGRGTIGEVYASLKPRVQDEARRQNRAQTPQAFGSTEAGLR